MEPSGTLRWGVALSGLFLFVLAVLALSGPGRIDIVDGQNRYLVARRPGRSRRRRHPRARLLVPGSAGPGRSALQHLPLPALPGGRARHPAGRRHRAGERSRREFFFTLIGSFAGAALAVVYALWFRSLGLVPAAAVGWALAGIFCTPNWYYSTSTFDDILGTLLIVSAVGLAGADRGRRPLLAAALQAWSWGSPSIPSNRWGFSSCPSWPWC